MCVCVRVRACVRVLACVRACVRACETDEIEMKLGHLTGKPYLISPLTFVESVPAIYE